MASDNIFVFLNPNANDSLKELKGKDLCEFMRLLDEFYLSMRESLGLSDNFSFGLEYEFEITMDKNVSSKHDLAMEFKSLALKEIDYELLKKSLCGYFTKKERTLDYGAEIATPILQDKIEY